MNRKQRRKALSLGPTGTHPRGKMNANDEGGLRFAVGHTAAEVTVDFGKPTAWIGMEPDLAEQLAQALLKHAAAVRTRAH